MADPIMPNVNHLSRSGLGFPPPDVFLPPGPPPLNWSKLLYSALIFFSISTSSSSGFLLLPGGGSLLPDGSLDDDDDDFSLSLDFCGFELPPPKNLPNPFGDPSLNSVPYLFNSNCKLVYETSGYLDNSEVFWITWKSIKFNEWMHWCCQKYTDWMHLCLKLTDLSVLNIHRLIPCNDFGSSRNIVCNIRCDIMVSGSVLTDDFGIQSKCFIRIE